MSRGNEMMVTAALLLGFIAGLWSFKVKARWCPRCGSTTSAYVSGGSEDKSHHVH